MNKEKGFSLLEVALSIALLGMVATAILGGLSTISNASFTTDRQSIAISLAQSQLEYIDSQPYQEAPDGGEVSYIEISDVPSNYSISSIDRTLVKVAGTPGTASIIGVPWDSSSGQAVVSDEGLQRISLIIYNGDKPVLELDAYKVKRW
jgi:prepilin-type N-terminal cleavage/methylation domain-containing protein